jgi:membrane-bound ClpP family serine protease
VWSGSDELVENLYQTFGVAITASLTLAQICLLLGLAGARRPLAPVMWGTVVLALVVAGLVSAMITGYEPPDGFLRTLGVVAILDVLGTLVTIAVGVFGRVERVAEAVTVTLPAALAERLRLQSSETGRPVSDLVGEAVQRYWELPLD